MATNRVRKTMQQQVGGVTSGTDSADGPGQDQELSDDQWVILEQLEHVGERLPSRRRDGSLPAWGGMDWREMTSEQQIVYLVGSLTKVAVEGAQVLESAGSNYEQTLTFYSELLHELDKGVNVPMDLKDVREQEVMDRCSGLAEEANGSRQEILWAAENNISALAVELQTAR